MTCCRPIGRWTAILVSLFMASYGFAASKTLIEMEGGKAVPALAKSFKKVSDGQYEFELDLNAEIGRGTKLSTDAVKNTLESKLGSTFGVKVTPKGASAVRVSYQGDENKFLKKLSRTKIRAGKAVALALESSVSDGGIRAKTADRPPAKNEVKLIVLMSNKQGIKAKAIDSKSTKIASGKVVNIKADGSKFKKAQTIFFVPEKKEKGAWVPKVGSLQ